MRGKSHWPIYFNLPPSHFHTGLFSFILPANRHTPALWPINLKHMLSEWDANLESRWTFLCRPTFDLYQVEHKSSYLTSKTKYIMIIAHLLNCIFELHIFYWPLVQLGGHLNLAGGHNFLLAPAANSCLLPLWSPAPKSPLMSLSTALMQFAAQTPTSEYNNVCPLLPDPEMVSRLIQSWPADRSLFSSVFPFSSLALFSSVHICHFSFPHWDFSPLFISDFPFSPLALFSSGEHMQLFFFLYWDQMAFQNSSESAKLLQN